MKYKHTYIPYRHIKYLLRYFQRLRALTEAEEKLIYIMKYKHNGEQFVWKQICSNAFVKGHLEPKHLKHSPLFTFSTKSLGQDSPSVFIFSITIGSKFTAAKVKLSEDSPS